MQIRLLVMAGFLLLAGACAQVSGAQGGGAAETGEVLPDVGPPVVNGFYEERQELPCAYESCRHVRAYPPFDLREQPSPGGAVVATITEPEWFGLIGTVYRLKPIRGVVGNTIEVDQMTGDGRVLRLEAGDVVYIVDTRTAIDDPTIRIWFRGEIYYYLGDPSHDIRWETPSPAQAAANAAAGEGWWPQVVRANGQRGFVLEAQVDCFRDEKDHTGVCEDGTMPGSRLND
jgi:hypothetical protein